jgi:hypothetical protein
MSRLEWIMEHEGKYYINPYWLNRNRIESSPEQEEGHNFRYPIYNCSIQIALSEDIPATLISHFTCRGKTLSMLWVCLQLNIRIANFQDRFMHKVIIASQAQVRNNAGTWNCRNADTIYDGRYPQLLIILVSQWKNHMVDEVYRCEGCLLW